MTLTGRTGTVAIVALVVSLCVNLLLAGFMVGSRWHDGPRHHRFFGGPMMGSVPEEARPLMREVFKFHKAEFDGHRAAIEQARMKVADVLKKDPIDQAQLNQALDELMRQTQSLHQFGHQVLVEVAQKLPPDLRREMADRWAKDRFRKVSPPD
ncbi:periplasmic heavy metal sensor [Dongia deserti]|uniref:periplasmic heavy metal sensor n=1 Tax=Dongia deserti TaxID=2268030 RepID=UPI000E64BBBD|nr:periplasmic heavy metal sensor [Dongia deserti]